MTLKEFSDKVGYSPSTISKALNNTSNCYTSEKVKNIIRQKALEFGYCPNLTARSLITQKNNTIGVLLPSIGGFYMELVRLMEFALEKRNYFGLFAFWKPEDGDDGFRKAYDRMIQRGIDGIITCHYTDWIKNCDIPLVVYGDKHEDIDNIFLDKQVYAQSAVDFLFKLGHRRIAFIGNLKDLRCKAYRTVLESKGITFNESWICDYAMELSGAEAAMEKILKLHDRPTAILAHNDVVAYAMINTILKAGLRVPQDISVIGFDNLPESKYYNPPLTTFDLNIGNVAELLADVVLRRIENPHMSRQAISIKADIIERASTGPFNKKGKELQ